MLTEVRFRTGPEVTRHGYSPHACGWAHAVPSAVFPHLAPREPATHVTKRLVEELTGAKGKVPREGLSTMRRGWLLVLALGAGCATTPPVASTFTYAPRTGTRYVRTVKVVTETSLVGTPYRERGEQEFVWNMAFTKQGDRFLVTHQLQRVSLRINDAQVLDGERRPGDPVSVDLLVSSEPRVLEVRGTERAAEVLSAMFTPPEAEVSSQMIGPEQVRQIAVALFEMTVRDVAGRPSAPGSTWVAADPDPTVTRKTLTVDRLEPCDTARCARISAQYEVNKEEAARQAMRSAETLLIRNGVNPAEAELVDATLVFTDDLLLEPGTLVDHTASFSRTARVTLARPGGGRVRLEFRTTLEQSSAFP